MNISKAILERVNAQLKTEFVGIDEIIDKLTNIFASWNDNIVRPIVVPVFGMTGVGKTSVIQRMIELLKLNDRTTNVPVGVCTKGNVDTRPAKVLLQSLGFADWENFKSIEDVPEDSILIIDEIQQLRTKDEDGIEIESEFNELYKIIDSGFVDYIPTGASEKARYEKCLQVLTKYVLPKHPDAIIENALTTDSGVIQTLMSLKFVSDDRENISKNKDKEYKPIKDLNSFYQDSDKSFERILDLTFELVPNKDEEEDNEGLLTLSMTPFRIREDIRSALNELSTPDKVEQFLSSITKKQTLKEYCNTLSEIISFINSPHHISFQKSIIFLIGNLDEAFSVSKDLDPDVDADVFHKLTKDVNVNDVKAALLNRFRPEQLARFGNNYIIFPSFSKESFKEIIKRYWENDVNSFSKSSGIKVNYSSNILDLLYSEGVFPTQGIRPILSTVSAFGFVFGEINGMSEGVNWNVTNAEITVTADDPNFKCDTADITIVIKNDKGDERIKKVAFPLYLGKLRNPKNDQNRYLKAVHELGHAVVTAIETGKLPSSIIITSSSSAGGFCMRNIKDINRRTLSNITDTLSDIKIALGGWISERTILPKELCSLGCGSDINTIWDEISYAYFKDGYLAPISYGRGDKPDGVPFGLEDPDIMGKVQEDIAELKEDVEKIIRKYTKLISWISLRLAEMGSCTEKELEILINEFTEDQKELGNEFLSEMNNKAMEKDFMLRKYTDILKEKSSEVKEEKENKPGFFKRLFNSLKKYTD